MFFSLGIGTCISRLNSTFSIIVTVTFPNLHIMQFPPQRTVTDFNQDPNIPFNTVFLTSTLRYESLGTVYTG
jgi:hypothetical protein